MSINLNFGIIFDNQADFPSLTLLLDGDSAAEIGPGSMPIERTFAFNQIRTESDSTTFTQNPDVPVSALAHSQPVLTYSDERKTFYLTCDTTNAQG